jgi:hypothetical protein
VLGVGEGVRRVFMADCSFKWLFESTSKRNINVDQSEESVFSCLR